LRIWARIETTLAEDDVVVSATVTPVPPAGREELLVHSPVGHAGQRTGGEDRLRFERLVADLAARFVNIPADEVDGAIVDSQHQIVLALDLDRSALFEITEGGDLRFTHAWTRPEREVTLPTLSARASFPWFLATLSAGEPAIVSDSDELGSAVDRESLRRVGTRATVAVPLLASGRLLGTLTFASMRAPRVWPAPVLDRLRLVGDVFTQALVRRQAHRDLQAALAEVSRLRDLLARDNEVLHREVQTLRPGRSIAAESAAAQAVLRRVDQVAPTTATVLLLGETGCGKELFAQAIHERSPRHKRPMVRVNCGAIPTALIESELFGRERGAYTGAVARQIGRFELAEGSTIFLDEVGELPIEAQVKLLHAVQDHVVERLGSTQPIKVDVRVIAATNRNLEEAVAAGTFREDLYYRLNVFPITVPPLRERAEDIPVLVWSFVDEYSRAFGKNVTSIAKEDMAALQRHPWPGNIRELRNLVERAMIVTTGSKLEIDLPPAPARAHDKSPRLADVEARHIRAILDHTGWRVRGAGGAAEILGVKPTTLEGRMAKLGIRRPDRRA
jgi:transcriptional regulator with GAF, ATPase, and Fis domain